MIEKIDHWAGDRLGRKQDAEFLYNFLVGEIDKRRSQGRVASYVLNVDADWGGGKSFFLDGLAQDIEGKGHLVARVNAWRDDHAQDPYVAIMAAIDKVFEPYTRKPGQVAEAWTKTKASGGAIALKVTGAILKGLVKRHAGVSLDEIGDIIADTGLSSEMLEGIAEDGMAAAGEQVEKLFDASLEAMIDGFKLTDAAMTDFRAKLEQAIAVVGEKKAAPLFILIDELDRCRPTYAVQLLERVKHLFDVPGVVFVFATNSAQLRHSIAGAYGANFDGFRYLKRFFERTYVFAEPSTTDLVSEIVGNFPAGKLSAPENDLVLALTLGCKAFELDLRAIRQVLEMVDAAATAWPHSLPADLTLIFALCVNFYQTGQAKWPSAQMDEIRSWQFSRSVQDRFERQMIDRSIHYGEVYRLAVGAFHSMEAIINQGRSVQGDIASQYVAGLFNPEWNGQRSTNKASIQTELLSIVANAGRLATPTGGNEIRTDTPSRVRIES